MKVLCNRKSALQREVIITKYSGCASLCWDVGGVVRTKTDEKPWRWHSRKIWWLLQEWQTRGHESGLPKPTGECIWMDLDRHVRFLLGKGVRALKKKHDTYYTLLFRKSRDTKEVAPFPKAKKISPDRWQPWERRVNEDSGYLLISSVLHDAARKN